MYFMVGYWDLEGIISGTNQANIHMAIYIYIYVYIYTEFTSNLQKDGFGS